MRPRPSHPPEFKARVALEALEGSDSLEALAERHGVPVESVMRWREVVRSQTPRLFQSPLLRLGLWLWPASVGRRFVVAITLGIAIGRLLPNAVPALEPIGLLGLKASQLMVMPLLICELLLALGSLPKGSMANLLRLGGASLATIWIIGAAAVLLMPLMLPQIQGSPFFHPSLLHARPSIDLIRSMVYSAKEQESQDNFDLQIQTKKRRVLVVAHWCQLKKKDLIFKKEERRLQRRKKAKIGQSNKKEDRAVSKPRPRKTGNPDLRRKTNQPGVEIPEITKKIFELLEPTMFTPLKYLQGNHEKIMRDRLLSLPVMVALMVSIVYQIAGLSEAVRVLKEEGLLWVEPLKVTKQAVSKRIMNVPAEIFAILLKGVLEKAAEKAEKIKVGEKWEKVREKFSAVWLMA